MRIASQLINPACSNPLGTSGLGESTMTAGENERSTSTPALEQFKAFISVRSERKLRTLGGNPHRVVLANRAK